VSLTATCLRAQCADTSEASTPRIAGALQVAGIRAHALLGVGYSVDQTTLRQLAEATDRVAEEGSVAWRCAAADGGAANGQK
jgi:hypothetical protein